MSAGTDPIDPGSGSWISWDVISGVPGPIKKLASSPVAFILGVVLNQLIGGVETITTAILDALLFVFVGDSATTTDGALALADIPLYVAEVLIGAVQPVATGIRTVARTFIDAITSVALAFGPLSPVVLAVAVGVVLVVSYYLMMALIRVALDVVPGLGGLI